MTDEVVQVAPDGVGLNATLVVDGNGNTVARLNVGIGGGTPGSPSGGVQSVQGVVGGVAIPVSGSLSATLSGFAPGGAYAQLSVSGTSGNVALPAGSVVVVYNTGANPAFVKLGASNTVVATTADDVVAAGGWSAFTVGANTYLAAITASSSTTLNLSGGSGLMTGVAGGSIATNYSLETGGNLAAIAAAQTTAQTSLSSIVTNTGKIPALGQAASASSVPVTLASNPDIRVSSASTTVADTASTSTAGFNGVNVLTGTPTAGSTLLQAINGQASVTVTLSAATATANMEVSGDGGVTFAPITMRQRGGAYTTSAPTGIGVYDGECAGKTHFRVRQTGAGGLTAAMTFSGITNTMEVMNPVRLVDSGGAINATIKAAATLSVAASDTALVATLRDGVTGAGTRVTVVPTVTASSYTAGYVVGGIMTFANALNASLAGILQNMTLTFKGSIQTTEMDVAIFSASPAGTFADHGAPSIATADSAILLGVYQLTNPQSVLGTHTVYELDGIAKQIVGSSTSLYAVVITRSATAANLASTSDMALSLGLIW
jgi:hypothetical protein